MNTTEQYHQVLETLYSMMPDFQKAGAGAYKPGLGRILEFERYLGNPHESFISVHVAGTNGKGSVSHMLASVLTAAGYRTGLYTSPHITDFRERIRVDGKKIPEQAVIGFAHKHMDEMSRSDLSFFEATVGMAFDWFRTSGVEIAVIETGLGGRLDATNIITPVLCVITNIGLEHTSFLGNTLEQIASEKAGIIKPGIPVVIGEKDPVTAPVFEAAAKAAEAPIIYAGEIFRVSGTNVIPSAMREFRIERLDSGEVSTYHSDLMGDYQKHNIVTVLTAIEVLRNSGSAQFPERAIEKGLAEASFSTGLRGRWQVLSDKPIIVVDTAHNAHGIRWVAEQIRNCEYSSLYMVFGFADDKDADAILAVLPSEAHYIFTHASSGRAMPVEILYAKAQKHGLKGEIIANPKEAVRRAEELATLEDMIFVGGSNFVVADSGLLDEKPGE